VKIQKEFDDILLEACKNYHSPHCSSAKDFKRDLTIFLTVKKQIQNYKKNNELNERLLLNNIIILTNVFSIPFVCNTLFQLIEHHDVLIPVLDFLKYIDISINDNTPQDANIVSLLQRI